MSKKLLTTISMTVALATRGIVAIPVAGADSGPPQQGGGCNMVFGPAFHSPNSGGLTNMMAGMRTAKGPRTCKTCLAASRLCSSASAARRAASEGNGEARVRGPLPRFGGHAIGEISRKRSSNPAASAGEERNSTGDCGVRLPC